MLWLLNPRVLFTLALVALLSFTHFTAYRKGKSEVRNEWKAAIAQANADARALEQRRQSAADAAQRIAASREAGLRAAAAGALGELDGLRNDLAALRVRSQSSGPTDQRTATLAALLAESAGEYQALAERCDRHVNDVRMLIEAWPK